MSQENNLNLNVADILNEIKGMSEEQINQIGNGWHGIPADRIPIYKGVMLALESNKNEQMNRKFSELHDNIDAENTTTTLSDVKIIMSFVEKILDKAKNQNPEHWQWINTIFHLFVSLRVASFKLCQSGIKIAQQDLKNVINLAERVLQCGNVTYTNFCYAVDGLFYAIDNFLYMLNENIETEDVAKIIGLAQSVSEDKGIKWNGITIRNMFFMLGRLLVNSSVLTQEQAVNVINLITKFVNKLRPNDQSLVRAVHGMLDTLCVILYKKNNSSKLAVTDCMKLVGDLLRKINKSVPNANLNTIQEVTNLVAVVVRYFAKNQEENIAIIKNCGFNIESGQIQSLDADKLKEFAGEYIANCWDYLTFTITKSQNYADIMSLLNVENPSTVNVNSLATLLSNLESECYGYANGKNGSLEDVVAVTRLIDKILSLNPAVALTNNMINDMIRSLADTAFRMANIQHQPTDQEKSQAETVISFVEKVLGANSKIKSNIDVIYYSFNVLTYLLNRGAFVEIGYTNRIIGLINATAGDENVDWGGHEILAMFRLLGATMRINPNCFEAKVGLDLVKKFLNIVPEGFDCSERIASVTLDIIWYYARNEENIEIIKDCGFNIENGCLQSLDTDKRKEFAGEFMADEIQKLLSPNLNKNLENPNGDQLNVNKETSLPVNTKINNTENNDSVEVLNIYKSADELLTSKVDKKEIASCLANVEVGLWDKFKLFFYWLWFMICNRKLISLDIYTKATKYYSGDKNKTQDDNQEVKNLNLGNKDKDNSEKEISLKDKIQNVLVNHPKSENNQENDEMLGNGN